MRFNPLLAPQDGGESVIEGVRRLHGPNGRKRGYQHRVLQQPTHAAKSVPPGQRRSVMDGLLRQHPPGRHPNADADQGYAHDDRIAARRPQHEPHGDIGCDEGGRAETARHGEGEAFPPRPSQDQHIGQRQDRRRAGRGDKPADRPGQKTVHQARRGVPKGREARQQGDGRPAILEPVGPDGDGRPRDQPPQHRRRQENSDLRPAESLRLHPQAGVRQADAQPAVHQGVVRRRAPFRGESHSGRNSRSSGRLDRFALRPSQSRVIS